MPRDTVSVDGRKVDITIEPRVYLAYNKPAGIVCTSDKKEKDNIIDHIDHPVRLTYAGRLDKRSTGLIIMTNDGDLINAMMRSRLAHEKEYEVSVDKDITDGFLKAMEGGVYIKELDETTRRCRVVKKGDKSFNIILTQGLNRQIRRMCEALGYKVRTLRRIRVVNITLGDLAEDEYRRLTDEELITLRRRIGIS